MDQCDIAIIIPLREEFEVFKSFVSIKNAHEYDAEYYYELNLPELPFKIVLVLLSRMGVTFSTHITEKLIQHLNPKLIILIGIAGSLDDDLFLGDVVIANEVHEYLANSKAVRKGQSFTFELSGKQWNSNYELIRFIENFEFLPDDKKYYKSWQEKVTNYKNSELNKEQKALTRIQPSHYIGQIASGPIVGASTKFKNFLLEKGNRKFLALEMESAGIEQAAFGHVYTKKNFNYN